MAGPRHRLSRAIACFVLLLPVHVLSTAAGCRVEVGSHDPGERSSSEGDAPSGPIVIYTSMYRSVIDALDPPLKEALPSVEVEWLQGGSEKIATRLDAELRAGGPKADIVMTSDPLWYERLKREGHLLPYASLRALQIPRDLVDRDGAYVTSRISTMVLAYNERLVSAGEAPKSFEELFSERWRREVTMPDPLGSGTAFATLSFLVEAFGHDTISRMKAVQAVPSGGSSSVIGRLESGEHKVAFVLLENVLSAQRNGSPIAFKVPREGAVLIPGPIAILRSSRNPRAARAVYDFLLSETAQKAIVAGDMHSPFDTLPAPRGAPAFDALLEGRFRWTRGFVDRAMQRTDETRKLFAEVMGGH